MQLLLAFTHEQTIAQSTKGYVGFCADHRFGHYRAYPILGIQWDIDNQWQLRLGLPDSQLKQKITPTLQWRLSLNPDGNEWHTLSKDSSNGQDRRSQFIRRSYLVQWHLTWQSLGDSSISLAIARQLETHYRFDQRNDKRVNSEVDNATRLTLGGQWHF